VPCLADGAVRVIANCKRGRGLRIRRAITRLSFVKLMLVCLCINASGNASADIDVANAAALRAAFIYNISKLVEWPANAFTTANAPFALCTLGVSATNIEALKPLEARAYLGHPFVVMAVNSLLDARKCHILYANNNGASSNADVAKALSAYPVLTISDEHGAADSGMAMEFVEMNGRLRWVMNLTATSKAQLKVSSKLIEIAVSVVGE